MITICFTLEELVELESQLSGDEEALKAQNPDAHNALMTIRHVLTGIERQANMRMDDILEERKKFKPVVINTGNGRGGGGGSIHTLTPKPSNPPSGPSGVSPSEDGSR